MTPLFRIAIAFSLIATPAVAQRAAKTPAAKKSAAKPAPAKAKPKAANSKPKTPPVTISPLSHDEKNGFSVLQVAVPDSNKFIAQWKLGGGGAGATTRTVANKPLFTFLVFRGCKANAEGNCDVVADYVIHRPDGTTNDENKGVVVWNKTAPADPKKPYLSDGALVYGVDEEGPFGDYRVVATVTDRVAGTTLTTEETLTIAPGKTAPAKPGTAPKPKAASAVDPGSSTENIPPPDSTTPDEPAPDAPEPDAPAPAAPAEPPAK